MIERKRRSVSWLAIFAIALHTILVGLMPLASAAPIDPFNVICHSQPADSSALPAGSGPASVPSGPCDHCKLCSAVATPTAPDTLLDSNLAPTSLVAVLYPASMAPAGGIARTPKLARGPPQRA
jgi:hypothetical protein